VHGPILGANIIYHTKYHQMRILDNLILEQGSDGCTIIDNYCNIFKTIDGVECLVLVVGEMKQRSLNDFIWEGDIPPNSKIS
jgi:hypothetical protein